jgi:hypothetical protein
MGKGNQERDEAFLAKYDEYVVSKIASAIKERLEGVPEQIVVMIKEEYENGDFVDNFMEKVRKHKADKSPVRKEDKKKKSESKKEKKAKKSDEEEEVKTPKPTKKRKDVNAPKGARNAKTMFKIDRAADLAGLSRDERFKKEKALYDALSDAQKKKYDDMAVKDKERNAREMELYKKGLFVPGKTPLPEVAMEADPKEEEKPAPEKEAKKKKSKPAPKEDEKEKEKDRKKKKAPKNKDSSESSSSDSESYALGISSDD